MRTSSYLLDLASELGYLSDATFKALNDRCELICRQLERLLQTMELLLIEEQTQRRRRKGPET
jgi:hypothetical protein